MALLAYTLELGFALDRSSSEYDPAYDGKYDGKYAYRCEDLHYCSDRDDALRQASSWLREAEEMNRRAYAIVKYVPVEKSVENQVLVGGDISLIEVEQKNYRDDVMDDIIYFLVGGGGTDRTVVVAAE